MKVVVLGGLGLQGKAALLDLARSEGVAEVICADVEAAGLERLARFADLRRIRTVRTDASLKAACDNPLSYKISWNWDMVLRTQQRDSVFVQDGRRLDIPAAEQHETGMIHTIHFPGLGELEAVPNGDAVFYTDLLGVTATIQRTGRYALRWPGWCAFWRPLKRLGFLKGLWMTVAVSGLSLAAGTLIGFLWGILRTSRVRFLRSVIGAWVDLIRGTPVLVQVFIVFFILPEAGIHLEAFAAAVLSLTNLAACFICEIVVAGIEAVPRGQREAARASGLSAGQQLRYVILPQAMRIILPPLVGQYVLLIKDSSVVSVIGVTDVTRAGWLTVQRVPEGLMVFGLVGILYFVVCYPLIHLSAALESRMAGGRVRL